MELEDMGENPPGLRTLVWVNVVNGRESCTYCRNSVGSTYSADAVGEQFFAEDRKLCVAPPCRCMLIDRRASDG